MDKRILDLVTDLRIKKWDDLKPVQRTLLNTYHSYFVHNEALSKMEEFSPLVKITVEKQIESNLNWIKTLYVNLNKGVLEYNDDFDFNIAMTDYKEV